MRTLSLALRNLLRNRRRSVTTLLAIIIGMTAVLLFGGYIQDINYGLQTNYVQHSGHLQIQHRDFFLYGSGNPAAYGIANYGEIITALKSDPVLAPMLLVATPSLQLGGIAGNFSEGLSRTVFATGFVVDDQNQMRHWNDYRFAGTPRDLALTGTPSDAAVIGTGVARVLQLCAPLQVERCPQPSAPAAPVGAELPADVKSLVEAGPAPRVKTEYPQIELLAATARGAPNVAELSVVKAEYQGVKELDDVYIALHLDQAQRLVYGKATPEATAIVLQLRHTNEIPAARARLESVLATKFPGEPLEVLDFETLNPFYGQTLALFGAIFGFITVLIGAIVLFTISNTMSMAVIERTSEIGTLRAIGLRRGGIRGLFLCEGTLIGIIGVILGVAIALLAGFLVNHGGLTWTPPGRVEPVPLSLRIWGETRLIVYSGIGMVLVAAVSAVFPAQRAARMNIVDALRHV